MAVIKGLEWTFDTVAPAYERLRPGYADELYRRLLAYIPITEASNVAEVGIGGGQATPPILRTGCRLTAIECGARFAELCREKFKDYPRFSVITGKFEELAFEPEQYDLVYSASAFHWIPEAVGYPKVFAMLRHGGAFARFANHPFADKGRPELSAAIQALYAVYMSGSTAPAEYSEAMARERAEIATRYGFVDTCYALFQRTRTFTAKEYVALLGTYSDHIALEEGTRTAFFREIERTIDRYGGAFTLYDTMDLELARKP